jgi:hypothetical protein
LIEDLGKNVIRIRLSFVNKSRSLSRCDSFYRDSIAVIQGVYAQKKSLPLVPNDIICECYCVNCKKAWFRLLINDTGNRLITVQLALQAFSAEQGAYPATLEVLVKAGYLPQLPTDPFALSGSFHYSRKGAGYLLYSLGPDGKDDGGKPIMDEKDPTKPATSLLTDDHGDIVAGVNIM